MVQDNVIANAFPATTYLVKIGQLIPSSTASVERVFSLMNGLCTPQRNRLSQAMLDSLMRICMSSPDDLPVNYERMNRIIQSFKNK